MTRLASILLAFALALPLPALGGNVVDQGQGAPHGIPWFTTPATPTGVLSGTILPLFTNVWPGQSMVTAPIAVNGVRSAAVDFILSSPAVTTGTLRSQCSIEVTPTVWIDQTSVAVTSALGTPGFSVNAAIPPVCKWLRGSWLSTTTPQQKIVTVADVAGSLAGKYVLVGGAQSATFPVGVQGMDQHLYALWFKVSGAGASPGPVTSGGRVYQPVEVDISTNDTAATVATTTSAAMVAARMDVITSTDGGSTWTMRALPVAQAGTWFGAFGNGTFAYTDSTRAWQSTNGIDWTSTTASTPNVVIKDAIFAGGSINLFVAVGGTTTANSIWTSPDGITWTAQTGAVNATMNCVAFNGTTIVALGAGTTAGQKSTDGTTWNSTVVPSATYTSCRHNGTNFAAVVSGGTTAASSADGTTWTSRTQISGSWTMMVAKPSGGFVATQSASATAQFSADGITWATITLPSAAPTSTSNQVLSFDSSSGRFLLLGGATTSLYSTDGVAWSSTLVPFTTAGLPTTSNGTGTIVAMLPGAGSTDFTNSTALAGAIVFVPATASNGTTAAAAGTSGFTVTQTYPLPGTFTSTISISP